MTQHSHRCNLPSAKKATANATARDGSGPKKASATEEKGKIDGSSGTSSKENADDAP